MTDMEVIDIRYGVDWGVKESCPYATISLRMPLSRVNDTVQAEYSEVGKALVEALEYYQRNRAFRDAL